MLSGDAGALPDNASSSFPSAVSNAPGSLAWPIGSMVQWRRAVRRRNKPSTKVSSLGTDDLRSERAVDHGMAPAIETVLWEDLGLERAAADASGDVDVLPPFAAGNVLPDSVDDVCRKAGTGPLGVFHDRSPESGAARISARDG